MPVCHKHPRRRFPGQFSCFRKRVSRGSVVEQCHALMSFGIRDVHQRRRIDTPAAARIISTKVAGSGTAALVPASAGGGLAEVGPPLVVMRVPIVPAMGSFGSTLSVPTFFRHTTNRPRRLCRSGCNHRAAGGGNAQTPSSKAAKCSTPAR